MSQTSANNKRIAKNTLVLYIRMLITMGIGLLTSRVILDSLGVEDYGIYNLVGGFVAVFTIVRAGLLTATQRFITYDLGTGDKNELNNTFSTCVIIFVFLSVAIFILAELIGVWFIESHLTIPDNRMKAAHWVFQLSVLTLVITLVSYPYNALVIAHERMKAFAYISVYEAVSKLLIAYGLYVSSYDRLIIYAFLLFLVHLSMRIMYSFYCKRHFEESKVKWAINWPKIRKIYSFTGWEMFGSIAHIGFTQGLNILLGMFFNPVVNAARGIAVQVQSMITSFVHNFQMALNPQITKSYAKNDLDYTYKLIYASSKCSFYLLLFFSLPIILEADTLLRLWLVNVPEYTIVFFRLIIITAIIDSLSNPIIKLVESTGNIKYYQLIVGGILLMIVPVSYIVLRLGGAPYSVFIVHVILSVIAFVVRLFMSSRVAGLSIYIFCKEVLLPIFVVTPLSVILPLLFHLCIGGDIPRLLIVFLVSFISTVAVVYLWGLKSNERNMFLAQISKFRHKND